MTVGESFEIDYEGYTFEITYKVSRGLYAGDPDRYYFEAEMTAGEESGQCGFPFWRSHAWSAKTAAKRAIKNEENESSIEKIKQKI